MAYFHAVIADAAKRFPIDRGRMMATGFFAGGMMVWKLLCARSRQFAAFAPMAGTFWLRAPQTCDGPVANVLHVHGLTDQTVPMTGRAIGSTRQGDVRKSIAMYRKFGGFRDAGTSKNAALELECALNWAASGEILDLCLYPGRHKFNSFYVKFTWEHFQKAGKL
jgi:polyhydroxybutyrate depolymerase